MLENNKWNKYINEYEKLYELEQKRKKETIPTLMELFERFDEKVCKTTEIYKLSSEMKSKIEEELTNDFSKNQKILLENWINCEDNILNDLIEQAFIYGYSLGSELKEESKKVLETI